VSVRRVGYLTTALSLRALNVAHWTAMLAQDRTWAAHVRQEIAVSTNEDKRDKQGQDEDDTEGHGLILDTDYYINRKMGRDAELEREARQRRQAKEARPNKTER
jgi:hypothetical protein